MERRTTAERQRQIAEAALDLLAEEGPRGFTTAALAHRVGLAEGTIFRHFADKQAIVRAAIDLVEARFAESFPAAGVDDPLARLGAFVRHRAGLVRRRPGLLRLLFSDQLAQVGSAVEAERLDTLKRASQDYVLDCLREAAARGVVRDDVPPEGLFVVVHGAAVAMAFSSGLCAGPASDQGYVWTTLERLIRAQPS